MGKEEADKLDGVCGRKSGEQPPLSTLAGPRHAYQHHYTTSLSVSHLTCACVRAYHPFFPLQIWPLFGNLEILTLLPERRFAP